MVENLTDVFTVVAFPSAVNLGPTFAVIFITRVAENIAYLVFQTEPWWRFRIWIKGKFKPSQVRQDRVGSGLCAVDRMAPAAGGAWR